MNCWFCWELALSSLSQPILKLFLRGLCALCGSSEWPLATAFICFLTFIVDKPCCVRKYSNNRARFYLLGLYSAIIRNRVFR